MKDKETNREGLYCKPDRCSKYGQEKEVKHSKKEENVWRRKDNVYDFYIIFCVVAVVV